MGRTSSVTVSLCSGFPGFSAAAWEAASRPSCCALLCSCSRSARTGRLPSLSSNSEQTAAACHTDQRCVEEQLQELVAEYAPG